MRYQFCALAIASAVLMPAEAKAAAFGIEHGAPLSSLSVVENLGESLYRIKVPLPNSEFEYYTAMVMPGIGVCKILATGKDYKGDLTGSDVRSTFKKFRLMLDERYGESEGFDFLKSGSIWDEIGDFAMALTKGQYVLTAYWTKESGSKLPADIDAIALTANAYGGATTYISLSYEFVNFEKCLERRDAVDARGL